MLKNRIEILVKSYTKEVERLREDKERYLESIYEYAESVNVNTDGSLRTIVLLTIKADDTVGKKALRTYRYYCNRHKELCTLQNVIDELEIALEN